MSKLDIAAAVDAYTQALSRKQQDIEDVDTATVTDVTNYDTTGKITALKGAEYVQVHCALLEEVSVGDSILIRPSRGLAGEWFAVGYNQTSGGSAIPTLRNLSLPDHTHASGSGQGGQLDWDDVWTDAAHDHTSAAEGGPTRAAKLLWIGW